MRRTILVVPNGARYHLMVPETDAEKQTGANAGVPRPYAGLIFNFDPPQIATMTMEKTPLALQIAFVGPDQVVHYVTQARARSGLHTSPQPSRWVIETFALWKLLKVGDRVQFARS